MSSILALAIDNLLTPMVLFFVLGAMAALARSDLSIPEAVAKGMSLYLMLAIGFKGGVGVAEHGVTSTLVLALLAGIALSALVPLIAYRLLTATSKLSTVDAAAVAAHYGSISIVTFLAGGQALESLGLRPQGFMVAVAAAMETPAIIVALWLARRGTGGLDREGVREVLFNGSIVVLVGSFAIGWITGKPGLDAIAPFITSPFKGVLCLFLLDMGILAGRGLLQARTSLTLPVALFGIYMPMIGAAVAAVFGLLIGLDRASLAIFMVLGGSASYIAVPAALRLALPEARPAVYLPLSLGITFPFNLTLGIPLYITVASVLR